MTERSKNIIAGMRRRTKILHIVATTATVAVGLLMLGLVYTFPKMPHAWMSLGITAVCIWYFLTEWNDVMHPERHDAERSATVAEGAR